MVVFNSGSKSAQRGGRAVDKDTCNDGGCALFDRLDFGQFSTPRSCHGSEQTLTPIRRKVGPLALVRRPTFTELRCPERLGGGFEVVASAWAIPLGRYIGRAFSSSS